MISGATAVDCAHDSSIQWAGTIHYSAYCQEVDELEEGDIRKALAVREDSFLFISQDKAVW